MLRNCPITDRGLLHPRNRDSFGSLAIYHESIYRFIYAQQARTKDYSWRLYLPRGKSRRGWRGRHGGNAIVRIPGWTLPLISTQSGRSPEAADHRTPGHWEAAPMLFGNHDQALLSHERHSRRILSSLPPELRRSADFDNGTEFARHYRLHARGIRTYFCNVRSPWQKRGV